MPVIVLNDIPRTSESANKLLMILRKCVSATLQIPEYKAWVFRIEIAPGNSLCNIWEEVENPPPIVHIRCKAHYNDAEITKLLNQLAIEISSHINCRLEDVFIGVERYQENNLFEHGNLYTL